MDNNDEKIIDEAKKLTEEFLNQVHETKIQESFDKKNVHQREDTRKENE